jgi:hypothetical protein
VQSGNYIQQFCVTLLSGKYIQQFCDTLYIQQFCVTLLSGKYIQQFCDTLYIQQFCDTFYIQQFCDTLFSFANTYSNSASHYFLLQSASLSQLVAGRLSLARVAIVPVVAMFDLIKLIPSNITIEYFQIDAQGHDLNVNNQEPKCNILAALTHTQVVKSARHLIHRIARVMLEVDVVKGQNPFFSIGGSNKQVAYVRQRRCPHLAAPQARSFDLASN